MVDPAAAAQTPTHLGRYELLAELGQGAMGVVYQARDPLLDRIVAIKTINLTLPKDELAEYEARFYQEARAAGGLNHPNIVTIYDIGKSDRVAYMAMEFLEGEELRAALVPEEPLPLGQSIDVAVQVAEGLAYAHARHVVHRDIKPANIMIVRDGLVKITDFGIARMRTTEVKTMTGMIMGSPKYMSPEQVQGKRADHRSDLFSLGVVLYEMLTGHPPFQGDSIHGVMFQILNATPLAPSMRNLQVPDILDLVVAKALAKNPEERYQTARELIEDLEACRSTPNNHRVPHASAATAVPASPTPPATTRHEDKVPTIRPAAATFGESDPVKPGMKISKSFDSYEATLRLAAMTGVEQEIASAIEPPSAPVRSSGAGEPAARETELRPAPRRPRKTRRPRYTWLYLLSLAVCVAALALFLMSR